MSKPAVCYQQKLDLWRKAIFLFHSYRGRSGPFKSAGFSRYSVEQVMCDAVGTESKPDIVSSNNDSWIILELTINGDSKKPKLEKYEKLDPSCLSTCGLHVVQCSPDVIVCRTSVVNDGAFCQLVLSEKLEVNDCGELQNPTLKSSLSSARGMDLSKTPDIPITLLPEFKGLEIRMGIVDQVMQLLESNITGKSPAQIVDDGLERLSDKISSTDRKELIRRVQFELDDLVKGRMKNYLTVDANGQYMAQHNFSNHPVTKKSIMTILTEWAGQGSPQTTLSTFGIFPSVNEGEDAS